MLLFGQVLPSHSLFICYTIQSFVCSFLLSDCSFHREFDADALVIPCELFVCLCVCEILYFVSNSIQISNILIQMPCSIVQKCLNMWKVYCVKFSRFRSKSIHACHNRGWYLCILWIIRIDFRAFDRFKHKHIHQSHRCHSNRTNFLFLFGSVFIHLSLYALNF